MKKVLLIALFLFIALPVSGALAEEFDLTNGYLINNTEGYTVESTFNLGEFPKLYDNDLSTYIKRVNQASSVIFKFEKPIDINTFYLKLDEGQTVNLGITSNEVYEIIPFSTGYTEYPIKNITEIKMSFPHLSQKVYEFNFLMDFEVKDPISNLSATQDYDSILLNWENPINDKYKGVTIKMDGEEIEKLGSDKNYYEILGLSPETIYVFDIIANYEDGGFSVPVSIDVTTDSLPELGEVTEVTANTDYNRVDLSWQLPTTPTLKYVNIYRDVHEEQPFLMSLFSTSTTGATTKIFETNGTYFNDLTVEPKTTYDYTLTTTDGYTESPGVDITITTPAAPIPEMGGVIVEPQPNGDYLYKWETPTAGQVKIVVGGEEYTTVAAEGQEYLIPAADMKYTGLGNPDVGLVPINEYGDEGTPLEPEKDLDEVELPFNVVDLLQSGVSLLLILGPFVLLSLAFMLFPRLRDTIRQALKNNKERRARNGSYRNN